MKTILIFAIAAFLFTSCGKKEDKGSFSGETESTRSVTAEDKSDNPESNKNQNASFKWDFNVVGHGKYDEPITQVNLIVNGTSHSIEKIDFSFSEITREGYDDFSIPEDAVIACRGWWAGAGIDYWIIQKQGSLDVYSRELGESMTDDGEPDGYMDKPKLLKTIKQ